MEPLLFAFLLSTLAGLCTTIGAVIVLFFRNPGPKFITLALSFSAGVMIFVSFVELLQDGINALGLMPGLIFFLIGMVIMMGIDKLVSHRYGFESEDGTSKGFYVLTPSKDPSCAVNINNSEQANPQEEGIDIQHGKNPGGSRGKGKHRHRKQQGQHLHAKRLERTSILVAIGIFIHNFPEGIATLAGTLKDVQLGILLATAIAIHNIPEGIIVAAPVCAASGNMKKAFYWSFISGISEPLGAIVAGLILLPFLNDMVISALLALVAGIMIFISLDELLPMCNEYKLEHLTILGLILGFLVMGISLAII